MSVPTSAGFPVPWYWDRSYDRLTMDFSLSEDQRAFQDAARRFAEEVFAPNAARWDAECIFPKAELREAAALGFGGLYVREDVGGSGLARTDAAVVFEELAAAARPLRPIFRSTIWPPG